MNQNQLNSHVTANLDYGRNQLLIRDIDAATLYYAKMNQTPYLITEEVYLAAWKVAVRGSQDQLAFWPLISGNRFGSDSESQEFSTLIFCLSLRSKVRSLAVNCFHYCSVTIYGLIWAFFMC